jgi:hypothetical protein
MEAPLNEQVKGAVEEAEQPKTPFNEYASTVDWLAWLNEDDTRRNYTHHVTRFLNWMSSTREKPLTPDDLKAMHHEKIKTELFKYMFHLKQVAVKTAGKPKLGQISVNSIGTLFVGIKSFLDYHEISTTYWKKLIKSKPKKVKNNLRGYLQPEIQLMIENGDPFDRANIVLFKGGGERVGGQYELLISDLDRFPEFEMGLLHVYRDSAEDYYTVPMSKEDLHYIDAMLKYRSDHGEKLTPNSPLIRDKFPPMSPRTNKPRLITRDAIRRRMKRLGEEVGLPMEVIAPDHSFRYFFDTALMNSDCKWEIKELMMGHSVRLDKFYYDEKNPESRKKLFMEYMKAVDSLTIMPQFKMTKRIAQLEKEVENSPKIQVMQDSLLAKEMQLQAMERKNEDERKSNEQKFALQQEQINYLMRVAMNKTGDSKAKDDATT